MDPDEFFEVMEQLRFTGPCTEPLSEVDLAPLRAHLDELLQEHHLTLVLDEKILWIDCHGDPDEGSIVLPRADCELGYFVALHEVGHLALGLWSFDESGRRYDNEATVDEWAIERALISPSDDAETKLINFLISDDPGPGRDEAPARVQSACAARRATATS